MSRHVKIPCKCGTLMSTTSSVCWACHTSKPKAKAPKKCPHCPAMIGWKSNTCKRCAHKERIDGDDATEAELDAIIAEQRPTMKDDGGGAYGYFSDPEAVAVHRIVRCDRRWKGAGMLLGGRL